MNERLEQFAIDEMGCLFGLTSPEKEEVRRALLQFEKQVVTTLYQHAKFAYPLKITFELTPEGACITESIIKEE
jgi:hypothetical protein